MTTSYKLEAQKKLKAEKVIERTRGKGTKGCIKRQLTKHTKKKNG